MKKIILTRHGETLWNTERRFQGKTDTPLNEEGKRQAELLAKRLNSDYEIGKIYSSPLQRAFNTAEKIAEDKNIPIVTREELKEVDFGRWEGLTLKEISDNFPDEFSRCRIDPIKHGFRDGLTFNEAKAAVEHFAVECIYNDDCESILVVSHAIILKLLSMILLGLPDTAFNIFILDNCSVSVITIADNKKSLLTFNDNSHIARGSNYLAEYKV